MGVDTIGVSVNERGPVLLLREHHGRGRVLPICVSAAEAQAIDRARAHTRDPRPRTHQLLADVITVTGRRLLRVCITALQENILHAELIFDQDTVVPARAIDAVALALHSRVPIFVGDQVLEDAEMIPDQVSGLDRDAAGDLNDAARGGGMRGTRDVEQFRRLLDALEPDDFRPPSDLDELRRPE